MLKNKYFGLHILSPNLKIETFEKKSKKLNAKNKKSKNWNKQSKFQQTIGIQTKNRNV